MRSPIALRALLVLLSCLAGLDARAEQVGNLYEADVPVASQDAEARAAAVRRGFAMVLVKVAGSERVLQNPAVSAELGSAQTQLVQYYFRRSELPLPEGSSEPELLLHVSFAPRAVEDILRRAGEAMISSSRPGTLLWLATDDGSGLRIVNRESAPELSAWLLDHAARRGFPLVFPALDLDDSLALTPEQVAALDATAVLAASGRYGADAVLSGRLVRVDDGQWIGEWQQQLGEAIVQGQGSASNPAELAGQLIDSLSETLAAHYAVGAELDTAGQVRVRIDGVKSFSVYWQLAGMLKRLAAVRGLQLALVDRETLFFDLASDASVESLERELGLFRVLRSEGQPGDLHYLWIGG